MDKKLNFYDIVKRERSNNKGQRNKLTFPKIERCEVCGGARYIGKQKIDNPTLALEIALVRFGYSNFQSEQFHICHLIHDDKKKDILDIVNDKMPTATICSSCFGIKGYYSKGKSYDDKLTGLKINLINFGKFTAKHFDNDLEIYICNCDEVLKNLEEKVSKLPVENFGEWMFVKETSNPRRGIKDYVRFVKTSREFSIEELETITEWLRRKDCPGWTGVKSVKRFGGYHFYTTWDSSD